MLDAFLSYNRSDQDAVEAIARALRDAGLSPFLDRWHLAAGRSWPELLEKRLAGARSVVVIVGPAGLGSWQQRECYKALDRRAGEPGFAVIPVLLPDVDDPALGFLGLNTWIDLREAAPGDGIQPLARAIRGEPPGDAQTRGDPRALICPYRGLRPFREEDAAFFFGRETFTATLAAKLSQRDFVAVVGASGSGKSSVVRAGLIPRLRRKRERNLLTHAAYDTLGGVEGAIAAHETILTGNDFRRLFFDDHGSTRAWILIGDENAPLTAHHPDSGRTQILRDVTAKEVRQVSEDGRTLCTEGTHGARLFSVGESRVADPVEVPACEKLLVHGNLIATDGFVGTAKDLRRTPLQDPEAA